jgi:hypothetical protein
MNMLEIAYYLLKKAFFEIHKTVRFVKIILTFVFERSKVYVVGGENGFEDDFWSTKYFINHQKKRKDENRKIKFRRF